MLSVRTQDFFDEPPGPGPMLSSSSSNDIERDMYHPTNSGSLSVYRDEPVPPVNVGKSKTNMSSHEPTVGSVVYSQTPQEPMTQRLSEDFA
jgi:hypothetical protein